MRSKNKQVSYNTLLNERFRNENKKLLFSLAGFVAVLAAVLTTSFFLLNQQQDIRQRASGGGYFRGINLMGPWQGPWGGTNVFATNAQLDYYNGKGLTTIRQPLLWEALQPTKFGPLDSTYLGMMDTFVSDLKARGMRLHFTFINQGVYPATSNTVISGDDLTDVWKKLVTHYKNEPTVWAYELMNEPYHDNNWNSHAQQTIDAIRTIDSTKPIIVTPLYQWPEGYVGFNGFADPSNNLIYEAHVYFDKDKSGSYSAGGYDAEGAYPMIGVDRSKPFVDWCVARSANCYMGEYGIPGGWTSGTPTTTYGEASNDPRWNVVLDNLLIYLDQNNISGTYWEGGPYGDVNSVEPNNLGQDRPQMAVLVQHLGTLQTTTTITPFSTPTPTTAPTPQVPSDTTRPTISITSPIPGSTVATRSTLNIQATATDNIGVAKVEFRINNSLVCSDSSSPYTCSWKVPGSKNKIYTIQAKAYDLTGNNSTVDINVTAK